jgi:thioredoxin reductase (NADPH)
MPAVKMEPKVKTLIKRGKSPFELIIIGGGPAGLTAGIYAKRAKIDTLLIEKALPGGIITSTEMVENYPGFPDGISGSDLGQRFEQQAKNNGLDIVYGRVNKIEQNEKIFKVFTEDEVYSSRTIIIASGGDPKPLNVPGEKEFTGKGVSYCATCDGPFYKDKTVAVIGGGNSAIEEALFLTKYAKVVTVIHRRKEFRAEPVLVDKAKANPKIFFMLDSVLESIVGDKKITSIVIKDVNTNKYTSVNIDGVFIYAGHKANTEFAKSLIKMDEQGAILTDENLATNVAGIFAAGDVRKKNIWQVITSAADGAIALHSVKEYLEK